MRRTFLTLLILVVSGLFIGCSKSSSPLGGKKSSTEQTSAGTSQSPGGDAPQVEDGEWEGYPDLPYVPIATEAAGIEIPRVFKQPKDYVPGGEVPADVGNPAAKNANDKPVTGGRVTIRFNAEPKTLNPITESSAYQTYIMQYVMEPLVWQNAETFEYEPFVAKKWIAEDSVKLRPDYPGYERQVQVANGEPANEAKVEIKGDAKGEPQPVSITVVDKSGNPVPKAWIKFEPDNADVEPLDLWTEDNGKLETVANGVGSYTVKVGAELYGNLEDADDGYQFTSAAEEEEKLELSLKKADVLEVARDTLFTYYLRDDVTWSDGEPFTSRDLEFAHAVINNPIVDGDQIRVYYSDVVEVVGLDKFTVRMKYRKQYFKAFEFTAGLGFYTPPVHLFEKLVKDKEGKSLTLDRLTEDQEKSQEAMSAHGVAFGQFFNAAQDYSRLPLGNGPYVVSEWSDQDGRVVLKRRDDYWADEHQGYLDEIVVRFIEDNTTALQALKTGEIDFFYRVAAEQFFEELDPVPDWLKKNYVKASWYSPGYSYVGWNLKKPFFSDRRVRLALAMLFNKQEFFEKKYHDDGVLVSGSQYYFGPAYDHEVGSVGYDPVAARDLLADAGWIDTNKDGVLDKDGKAFRFKALLPPGNQTAEDMMAILQREFQDAGIVMEVQLMEWASFVEKLQSRDFECVTLSWASELESDPYQLWHSSGAAEGNRGSNHVGFVNQEADDLIAKIRVTLDPEARKRLFFDFHRVLDREQPYLFLWTPRDRGIYHQKFRGVKWYALRPGFDLREWWIPKDLQ